MNHYLIEVDRALKFSFGMALDTVLNESNIHYDSDSSHEDENQLRYITPSSIHDPSRNNDILGMYLTAS